MYECTGLDYLEEDKINTPRGSYRLALSIEVYLDPYINVVRFFA